MLQSRCYTLYFIFFFILVLLLFENPWESRPEQQSSKDNNSSHNDSILSKLLSFIGMKSDKKKDTSKSPMFHIKNSLQIVLLLCLVGWMSTGFYTVNQDEEAVVLRLGKYNRTAFPGLNWKLPDPIESVEKISVTRFKKEFVGIKVNNNTVAKLALHKLLSNSMTTNLSRDNARDNNIAAIPGESQMLTGDENIIEMHFFVQWRIKNAKDFLFNLHDNIGENTVRSSAESAMREVIAFTKLYDALSEQRNNIEEKAHKILQSILDRYNSGIEVMKIGILHSHVAPEVRDSYRDIQSAKADRERSINQARGYTNTILPEARANARSEIEKAEGYKQIKINQAMGKANSFQMINDCYKISPEVVRQTLYLETMEEVYKDANKIIVDDPRNSSLLLPFLSQKITSNNQNTATESNLGNLPESQISENLNNLGNNKKIDFANPENKSVIKSSS